MFCLSSFPSGDFPQEFSQISLPIAIQHNGVPQMSNGFEGDNRLAGEWPKVTVLAFNNDDTSMICIVNDMDVVVRSYKFQNLLRDTIVVAYDSQVKVRYLTKAPSTHISGFLCVPAFVCYDFVWA